MSNLEPNEYTNPETYKTGARQAKQRAIELYEHYLKMQESPHEKIRERLKALKEKPKG